MSDSPIVRRDPGTRSRRSRRSRNPLPKRVSNPTSPAHVSCLGPRPTGTSVGATRSILHIVSAAGWSRSTGTSVGEHRSILHIVSAPPWSHFPILKLLGCVWGAVWDLRIAPTDRELNPAWIRFGSGLIRQAAGSPPVWIRFDPVGAGSGL